MDDPNRSWYLANAQERAKTAPETLFIPSAEVRHSLKAGGTIGEVSLILLA